MTSKEYVKSKSSVAKAVKITDNSGKKYWAIKRGNKDQYMAIGLTESSAWVNAKNKIINHLKNKEK